MPDSFPYGAKTYAYDGDRLTGCSNNNGVTWTFAHDNMGRMTSDGHSGTAISYNMIDLPSKITKSDGSVVKYSYLADGRKVSSLTGNGIGLVYRGPFVYRRDASGALTFESASCEGGRLEPDAAYRYVTDHLGSTRAVARMDTYAVGDIVDYSSYGERTQVSGVSQTRLYFTGKEDQSVDFGLPYVDFGARHYSAVLHRWLVPDPLGDKTPTVSAYAYCAGDPVNLVDPDGRDVWEIDEMGKIVNRIKDKTQDSFQIVRKDEEGEWRRTEQSISFEYGTIQAVRNPNATATDDTSYNLTIFEVKNDDNAKNLFEFMANPEVTSVEWEHIKIGTSDSGRNIVGNSHDPKNTLLLGYLLKNGYTLREANHNHPSWNPGYSENDLKVAEYVLSKFPECVFHTYVHPGIYTSFGK